MRAKVCTAQDGIGRIIDCCRLCRVGLRVDSASIENRRVTVCCRQGGERVATEHLYPLTGGGVLHLAFFVLGLYRKHKGTRPNHPHHHKKSSPPPPPPSTPFKPPPP